jgi:thymidylate synthase
MVCQFYISRNKYLHCKLYMRSNDIFLGAPFNIAQYSLLTYMIASMTGYTPGDLIYSLGDAHIYSNHVEQMREQIMRPMRDLPRLSVIRVPENIEDFEFSCFKISTTNPHPSIKGVMAV